MMLAKLAQTAADRIARIQEDLPFGGDNNNTNNQEEEDDNEEEEDETLQSPTVPPPKTPTNSTTPTQFLKKLRSPSIVSRQHTSGSLTSISTIESLEDNNNNNNNNNSAQSFVSASITDSLRCNKANMPNKITGEMGVEIYPCPHGKEELILKYVHDRHFQYIHPNVFAPACLTNVQRMGGGGSGVSVFSGVHPLLGEIVMKHGGFSDMKELFALGTIASELNRRGKANSTTRSKKAAVAMKACLPEFKMVYISPQHVLYKPKAVWGKLKKLVKIGRDRHTRDSFASLAMKIEMSERHLQTRKSSTCSGGGITIPQLITFNDSKFLGPGANIRIYECDSGKPVAFIENCNIVKRPCLNFVVPKPHTRSIDTTALALDCTQDFDSLQHLYEGLSPLMSKHLFKFTLAQKRIGGPHAKTGSQWLYEGRLDGLVLGNLIAKFIETVRNLQALTLPEEVDVLDQIRKEVRELRLQTNVNSDGLSQMADQFMGNAIKKNFHPTKGRMRFLRKTCKAFREDSFYLLEEEVLPARHLATLGEPDVLMSDVFVGASSEPPLFHPDKNFWLNLLQQATRPGCCPNATKRVWTSGLCDAGIHNLFVCEKELYFFDLGVPQLQSLPGFMTKFLFSFFHILGMEEDETSHDNEWVRRFVPQGDKLALTQETKDLLPKAYDAFEVSLSRIIDEVFDGDQSLRWLLLQYVTLQLLSDASFCLQRWSMKGGGHPREDNNHNEGLERWLWRALWDTYVAFDINTLESWERLRVEHPDCSHSSTEDQLRASVRKSIDDQELQELLKLDQLMDIQEGSCETNHYSSNRHNSSLSPMTKRESSEIRRNSLRWSSERLNLSTLRELTAATFEYKETTSNMNSDDEYYDDEDSETESESADLSMVLPAGPPLYSLESLEEEDRENES